MSEQTSVTVERVIDVPVDAVFDVLSNPERHPDLDGSGFVRSVDHADRIQQVGEVFTMNMNGPHMGGDYQTDNHVTGYAKDKLAAKPMVKYENDELIAISSEEVGLNRLFPGQALETSEPAPLTCGLWSRN